LHAVRSASSGTALAVIPSVANILIADDEPHVVELVRVTLEDDRVRVFDAADGRTALELAQALRLDLVLLDVQLPDVSGLEVCRQLRAHPRLAATKVIMLTAAAQQDDITRGFGAGATDYLTKPFSPVRLLSMVERLVPRLAWPPA
jgi:DNA-binding response OmpR family regulator